MPINVPSILPLRPVDPEQRYPSGYEPGGQYVPGRYTPAPAPAPAARPAPAAQQAPAAPPSPALAPAARPAVTPPSRPSPEAWLEALEETGATELDVEAEANTLRKIEQDYFRQELMARTGQTPEQVSEELRRRREDLEKKREELRSGAVAAGLLSEEPGRPSLMQQELERAGEERQRRLAEARRAWETTAAEALPDAKALAQQLEPRPFLSGPAKDALPRVTYGLSLLATLMGGLLGGAPRAALAAWTGALEGWKAGDHERAERAWRMFQAQLSVASRKLDTAWRSWEMAREESGLHLEQVKTRWATKLAEHNLLKDFLGLQEKSVNDIDAILNSARTAAHQTVRDAIDLAKAKAQLESQTVMRALMLGQRIEERHARELQREEERQTRILGQKHTQDMLQTMQMMASARQLVLPQLRWAVDVLDKAGILQTAPAMLGWSVSKIREYLVGIRDPRVPIALNYLQRFAAAFDVGFDRAMGLPAGTLRIAKVALAQLEGLERAPRAYWDTLLQIVERQLLAQESGLFTMLKKRKVDDDVLRAWLEPDPTIIDRFLQGSKP
jgi:hypothetical protein